MALARHRFTWSIRIVFLLDNIDRWIAHRETPNERHNWGVRGRGHARVRFRPLKGICLATLDIPGDFPISTNRRDLNPSAAAFFRDAINIQRWPLNVR